MSNNGKNSHMGTFSWVRNRFFLPMRFATWVRKQGFLHTSGATWTDNASFLRMNY
jgi:hypothetical protein